jgi:hypothetical protein
MTDLEARLLYQLTVQGKATLPALAAACHAPIPETDAAIAKLKRECRIVQTGDVYALAPTDGDYGDALELVT